MQPKTYTVSSDKKPEAMRIFKPTILFVTVLVLLVITYIFHWKEKIELRYERVIAGDVWRLWSCLIGSSSFHELAANFLSVLLLTIISERTKGTVSWIVDAFVKSGLINMLSFLLYLLFRWLAVQSTCDFLVFLVQTQSVTSNFGLQYLVIAEIFLVLTRTRVNQPSNDSAQSYSFLMHTFLAFYFTILCCVYFRYFGVVSAITIALIAKAFHFEERLTQSWIIKMIEKRLICLHFGLYFSSKEFDPNATINQFHHLSVDSSGSRSLRDSSNDDYQELHSVKQKSIDKEEYSHDKSKSRGPYDEVAINDFILEPPTNHSVDPKDDNSSFVI